MHPAGLRLLRHHQGHRPQARHRPHQAARLHRGDPGELGPQGGLVVSGPVEPLWMSASACSVFTCRGLGRKECDIVNASSLRMFDNSVV